MGKLAVATRCKVSSTLEEQISADLEIEHHILPYLSSIFSILVTMLRDIYRKFAVETRDPSLPT